MLWTESEVFVARHLKTANDLFDSKPSPRAESTVAAAVQWAERIRRKIDNVFGKKAEEDNPASMPAPACIASTANHDLSRGYGINDAVLEAESESADTEQGE